MELRVQRRAGEAESKITGGVGWMERAVTVAGDAK